VHPERSATRRPDGGGRAAARTRRAGPHDVRRGERGEALRLAMSEFLTGAALFALGVLVLGALVHVLDRTRPSPLEPLRTWLTHSVFTEAEATASLLQNISATVITVASITFSLMLVALQQSASSLTGQVFDQFMRRRTNQFYFGFFVGLGAYSLLQTTTVHEGFNPVFGAGLTVAMSVVAVGLLLVLVYAAVNQMRPVVIVEAMHDHLIEARLRQLRWIVARTHRTPRLEGVGETPVTSDRTGFVLRIDLDAIQGAVAGVRGPCEVVLEVCIGSYVAYGDVIARVRGTDADGVRRVAPAIERAVRLERQRNIDAVDASYGLEQLETVGWTSTSGAQHNPQAARLVVAALRDVLARLAVEADGHQDDPDTDIVYRDDFPAVLMNAIESLAVVTADSQQHQVASDIVLALDAVLERLTPAYRGRAVDVLMRTLPALASHPPTLRLETSLEQVRDTLQRMGEDAGARAVDVAVDHLRRRIGTVEVEYTPR
jgi:uncharacterized membrane protein